MRYVYLNHEFLYRGVAGLAIDDRGFRFGDGAFETIRVLAGVPLFLGRHLQRLRGGCTSLGFQAPAVEESVLAELLARNEAPDCLLRIAVSRGVGSAGYRPTGDGAPTLLIETMPLRPVPAEPVALYLSGWARPTPDVLPTSYKLSQGVNSTLARLEAVEEGCFEALQLNTRGEICEASGANVFWLYENALYTPSLVTGALAGITRGLVIEESPVQVVEGRFPIEALEQAEAVVLTNTAYGCLAVERLAPQGWQWQSMELAALLNARLDALAEAAIAR